MRRPEDMEMKPGNCDEEDGKYATLFAHNTQKKKGDAEGNCDEEDGKYATLFDHHAQKKKGDAEGAKNTYGRPILILVVLLIFLFIGLTILTAFLFISNKNIREEISQMNGSLSTEIQRVLGAVKNMQEIQKESNSLVMSKATEIESSLNRISGEIIVFKQKVSPILGGLFSRRRRTLSGDELNDGLKASSLSEKNIS